MKPSITLACVLLVCTAAAGQQASAPQVVSHPVRILIAYYSQTGNTRKLAEAVREGAISVPGVEVTLQSTTEVKDASIPAYDGIVVGTPVYWSNISSEAKHFLERVGAALWMAKSNGDGRTAGAFCTGGEFAMGKDLARMSIIAAFLTMRFMVIGGVNEHGYGTLGPEATTGLSDPGVSAKEQEEGRRFGERFARFTREIRSSR